MEIRFKEKEIGDLALLMHKLYRIKESVDDVAYEIAYAVRIVDMYQEKAGIVVYKGSVYATLSSKVGLSELIGVISRKGKDYVCEIK